MHAGRAAAIHGFKLKKKQQQQHHHHKEKENNDIEGRGQRYLDESQPASPTAINTAGQKRRARLRSSQPDQVLKFYSVPVVTWTIGMLIIIVGIVLIANLAQHNDRKLFRKFGEGQWWQYLICVLILLIGTLFIFAVKFELVIFDKELNRVTLKNQNICCWKKVTHQELNQIVSVRIVKRGRNNAMNQTLHYKIIIFFEKAGDVLEMCETNSGTTIKQKFCDLKKFLGQPITNEADIRIIDETQPGPGQA